MKKKVRGLLVTGTVENVETLDWQTQYLEVLETLRKFGLASDALPTLEAVQGAFSAEKNAAIATLREPRLVLVPDVDFSQIVLAINASGLTRQPTYVNESVFGQVGKQRGQKPTAYQPRIIEGAQEMGIASYDDTRLALKDCISSMRQHRAPDVEGVDRRQYAILQMHALMKGTPVDRQTWTILDSDTALQGNVVPFGGWFGDRVDFGLVHSDRPYEAARFRSSVGGDVLQS